MKIYDANKSFTIISNWKKKNTMVTSKGPVVPIKLARNVELLVASLQHIMWAIGNTNLFGTHLNPNVEGMGKIFWSQNWILQKTNIEQYKSVIDTYGSKAHFFFDNVWSCYM